MKDYTVDKLVTDEIKKEIFENVVDTLAYDQDAELRNDYSGRGMYGDKCLAIVTDNRIDMELPLIFVEEIIGRIDCDADKALAVAREILPNRIDNMGRGYVYY